MVGREGIVGGLSGIACPRAADFASPTLRLISVDARLLTADIAGEDCPVLGVEDLPLLSRRRATDESLPFRMVVFALEVTR